MKRVIRRPKINRALKYMIDHPEATPYEAAKAVNMSPQPLYVKLKAMKAAHAGICECCGQPLPKQQTQVSVEAITPQKN